MKLIDKDALVAEINRRKEKYITERLRAETINGKNILGARIAMLEEMLVLVNNTLEVKEVDLEKELIQWHKNHFERNGTFIGMNGFYLENASQIDIARHFFELGIKAQKEEKMDLDKEIDLVEDKYYGFESLSRADVIEIIKYFFELGLKENRYKTQLSDEI